MISTQWIITVFGVQCMLPFSYGSNITDLLDKLLLGYDRRLRPGFGGPPITVEVNINIRSMGPISEVDMAYQMDCYFRQSWIDSRLAFLSHIDTLAVGVHVLNRIWKPDTHFFNGKRSYIHTVTEPNKLLRIGQDGKLLYSMRLTVKASCPMHLENFPMDTQSCPLKFGSHGYLTNDVLYKWRTRGKEKEIEMSDDMRLSQFDLIDRRAGNDTSTHVSTIGMMSTLTVDFTLKRHMGYFVINVYVPCSLLVVISWVGFWINREATADRIALGVTTVLTMAFLSIDNRVDLPKVSYSTAIDYFVAVCFIFVVATILQFAGVHYFTKNGSGEVRVDSDEEEAEVEEEAEGDEEKQGHSTVYMNCNATHSAHGDQGCWEDDKKTSHGNGSSVPHDHQEDVSRCTSECNSQISQESVLRADRRRPSAKESKNHHSSERRKSHVYYGNSNSRSYCFRQFYSCLFRSRPYDDLRLRTKQSSGSGTNTRQMNSVSRIDTTCRVMFPMAFIIFNAVYWFSYIQRGRAMHTKLAS